MIHSPWFLWQWWGSCRQGWPGTRSSLPRRNSPPQSREPGTAILSPWTGSCGLYTVYIFSWLKRSCITFLQPVVLMSTCTCKERVRWQNTALYVQFMLLQRMYFINLKFKTLKKILYISCIPTQKIVPLWTMTDHLNAQLALCLCNVTSVTMANVFSPTVMDSYNRWMAAHWEPSDKFSQIQQMHFLHYKDPSSEHSLAVHVSSAQLLFLHLLYRRCCCIGRNVPVIHMGVLTV